MNKVDVAVEEELMDYAFVDKKTLARYDLEKTEENVLEIMSDLFKAQYRYTNLAFPRMTINYEVRYEEFTQTGRTDHSSDYVEIKEDTRQEILKFNRTITSVISKMNNLERVYYTEYLLNGKSERYTAEVIGVSRNGLIPIKNSCIMKIALAFNKEVEK